MPALRHRKECYVESDVIAQYLDFFFQGKNSGSGSDDESFANLSPYSSSEMEAGGGCTDGFFPRRGQIFEIGREWIRGRFDIERKFKNGSGEN